MNQEDFTKIVNGTMDSIHKLLVVKGGEYASSDDRLSNFKRGAVLTGCTPLQVCFIYLSKHYDGIASYVKTHAAGTVRPSSEPIEGRLDDLINYCLLAKAIIAESAVVPVRDSGGDRDRFWGGPDTPILSRMAVQPPPDAPSQP